MPMLKRTCECYRFLMSSLCCIVILAALVIQPAAAKDPAHRTRNG